MKGDGGKEAKWKKSINVIIIMELIAKLASGLSTVDSLAMPLERVNGVVVAFIKVVGTILVSVHRITNVPKADPAYIDSSSTSFFSLFHFTPCKVYIHGSTFTLLLCTFVCYRLCLCCIHGNQRMGYALSPRFKMLSNTFNTDSRACHIQGSRKNVSLWPCVCSQRLRNVHPYISIGISTTTTQCAAPSWLFITASCHWQTLFQYLYRAASLRPCTCFYRRIDLGGIHVLKRGYLTHTRIYPYIIFVLYPPLIWIHLHHCL